MKFQKRVQNLGNKDLGFFGGVGGIVGISVAVLLTILSMTKFKESQVVKSRAAGCQTYCSGNRLYYCDLNYQQQNMLCGYGCRQDSNGYYNCYKCKEGTRTCIDRRVSQRCQFQSILGGKAAVYNMQNYNCCKGNGTSCSGGWCTGPSSLCN